MRKMTRTIRDVSSSNLEAQRDKIRQWASNMFLYHSFQIFPPSERHDSAGISMEIDDTIEDSFEGGEGWDGE